MGIMALLRSCVISAVGSRQIEIRGRDERARGGLRGGKVQRLQEPWVLQIDGRDEGVVFVMMGLELGLDVLKYWSSPATVNAGLETLVMPRSLVAEDFRCVGSLYRVSMCMCSAAVPAKKHSVTLFCNHISSSQLYYPQ